MSGNNVNTQVTVTAQAKGFQQAQTAATKLTKALKDGTEKISAKKFKSEMHEMEHSLQKVAKQQLKLNDSMKAMSKGSAEFKKATSELEKLEQQARSTEKRISLLSKAFGSKRASAMEHAHGGFTQGLLGGGLPGVHQMLERGPGVWAQAGGHALGHMAQHVAGGLAATPMHGIAGIAHAMGAIPTVGGPAGQLLQEGAAMAASSIENIKKRQELRPFMSGIISSRLESQDAVGTRSAHTYNKIIHGKSLEIDDGDTFRKETIDERIARAKQTADDILDKGNASFLGNIGTRFGMSSMEVSGFGGDITRAGGGRGAELRSQGMLGAALGAKRAYGVEAGTSGAFLSAGRRGGFAQGSNTTFGQDNGGGALAKTISAGLASGLEGSELTHFVEEMASNLEAWKTTGILVDPKSVSDLGKEVSKTGLGVIRGMNVGKDFASFGQRMADNGPQSGFDFAAAQDLYGFTPGGGAKGAWEFQKNASKGARGIKAGGIEKFLTGLAGRYSDTDEAKLYASKALKKGGIGIGDEELDELFDLINAKKSGNLSDKQKAKLENAGLASDQNRAEAEEVAGGLAEKGAQGTDARLRGAASLENQKDIIGQKMIPAVHAFEQASLTMVQAVTTKLSPSVLIIATAAEHLADKVNKLINGSDSIFVGGK